MNELEFVERFEKGSDYTCDEEHIVYYFWSNNIPRTEEVILNEIEYNCNEVKILRIELESLRKDIQLEIEIKKLS